MNYKEIESFKSILLQMVKQGCSIKNDDFSVDGRVAGVGFKPYWTYPTDSKINKLEFNILDNRGRIAPFYLYNIIGCDVTAQDGVSLDKSKNLKLDIHVFSPSKVRDSEPYDKISIQINME
jgi:hypothetical protein